MRETGRKRADPNPQRLTVLRQWRFLFWLFALVQVCPSLSCDCRSRSAFQKVFFLGVGTKLKRETCLVSQFKRRDYTLNMCVEGGGVVGGKSPLRVAMMRMLGTGLDWS